MNRINILIMCYDILFLVLYTAVCLLMVFAYFHVSCSIVEWILGMARIGVWDMDNAVFLCWVYVVCSSVSFIVVLFLFLKLLVEKGFILF